MPASGHVLGQPSLRVAVLGAPLIFVAHFTEEAPGFVAWFNAHVARGITQPLFWTVNQTALVITLIVVALEWSAASTVSAVAIVAWLSCLMLANALFHLAGALVDGAYMPGVVTAVLLYLPFYGWIVGRLLRQRRLTPGVAVVAALLGAAPMLAHGYLIVFRGSRLF